jgi:hypothetical protein|tara:strand:- start:8 stop:142 length:135 start_codon:yes stop_codon:yes gene_type:complete
MIKQLRWDHLLQMMSKIQALGALSVALFSLGLRVFAVLQGVKSV